MQSYMIIHARVENGIAYLNSEVQLCTDVFMTCLPTVELFNEISLMYVENSLRKKRGILAYIVLN